MVPVAHQIIHPTVDDMPSPLGVDSPRPIFRWRYSNLPKIWHPKTLRIVVQLRSKSGELEPVWDSGLVKAGGTPAFQYSGPGLQSASTYVWHVEVFDAEGVCVRMREPASFETGLFSIACWKGAQWMGGGDIYRDTCSIQFRLSLQIRGKVTRARVYATGLGYHEFYCNGKKAGDRVLDPAQTDYRQRIFYNVHDLTSELVPGENVIGFLLGDGFFHQSRVLDTPGMVDGHGVYAPPCAILLLRLEYADGSEEFHISGETGWKVHVGPITQNNVFSGETFDARLWNPAWATTEFDDSSWAPAVEVTAPGGMLKSSSLPPIRKIAEIQPVAITEPLKGVFVIDFGENMAGWARLRLRAHPGAEVTMRFAEVIDTKGHIDTDSGGTFHTKVIQTDRYICGTHDWEVYEPKFTYHGFRYVEVTNFPGTPDLKTLTAIKVHTDLKNAAGFACSNSLLNDLHTALKNTLTSNLHGLPTDCPIRERCGWTGDAWLICDTLLYYFDSASFLNKYLGDIKSSRAEYGKWMHVVPGRRTCLEAGPLWTLAQIIIPWRIYRMTGARQVLEENFPAICDWVAYYALKMKEGALGEFPPVGDHAAPLHLDIPGNSTEAFALGAVYSGSHLAGNIADELGLGDVAAHFRTLSGEIQKSLYKTYFNAEKFSFGCQSLDAFAIKSGFARKKDHAQLAATIVKSIRQAKDHFVAGAVGMRYLFQVLTEFGYENLLLRVLENPTYPSLKAHMERGATTLWETWESDQSQNDSSRNHPFKGGFGSWFYSHLLGIRPIQPGFATFCIRPMGLGLANWASGRYLSPFGRIEVRWERVGSRFRMDIEVPTATIAHVFLPGEDGEQNAIIAEAGKHHFESNLAAMEPLQPMTLLFT